MKKTPWGLYYKAKDFGARLSLEEEQIILKSSAYSYWYARDVIKGRWKEAEETIQRDSHIWYGYKQLFAQEFEIEEILNS